MVIDKIKNHTGFFVSFYIKQLFYYSPNFELCHSES